MKKEKTVINPICGKRLQELIQESGMSQKEFAEKANYTPEYISNLVTGKKAFPIGTAREFINNFFPNIRLEWLMGDDECKTVSEHQMSSFRNDLDKVFRPLYDYNMRWDVVQYFLEALSWQWTTTDLAEAPIEERIECERARNFLLFYRALKRPHNETVREILGDSFEEVERKMDDFVDSWFDFIPEERDQEEYIRYITDHYSEEMKSASELMERCLKEKRSKCPCICDENNNILVRFTPEKGEMFVNELYDVVYALVTHHIRQSGEEKNNG
ncbi:MAG: helix-turn-helix transcriptional regulator [Clostridia bacterium]|nr:helix-turn-helix transcriptional regulator [Clostridia bacterium]